MNLFSDELNETRTEIIIIDEQVHHVKNVLRGKIGDDVFIYNGKGLISTGQVLSLTKKELVASVVTLAVAKKEQRLGLSLCVPKKEYLESAIKCAVQMGLTEINLVQSDYSPWKYKESNRISKLIKSSLLQSENPFSLEVNWFPSLEAFLQKDEDFLVFSTEVEPRPLEVWKSIENILIGPEGGFSSDEICLFKRLPNVFFIKLDLPIMKSETAVPFCYGYTLAKH